MNTEKLQIVCKDGYKLGATLFLPKNPLTAVIQINSASATPQGFYKNFAEYLSSKDSYAVLTFDYRGIGKSKPINGLKDFEVEYIHWATKDTAAVTDYLSERFVGLPLFYFGHSFGGQTIGLIPNLKKVSGLVTVGTSSGYVKNMKKLYRAKSFLFFEVVRPTSNAIFGYSRLKSIGIMEDLPKNLINSWRNWCNVPDYFFDPKHYSEIAEISNFKNFEVPIDVLIASDDEICTPKNVENFWKHVASTKTITVQYIDPSEYGKKEIGHFGFFRKIFNKTLWPIGLDKLQKQITNEKSRNNSVI